MNKHIAAALPVFAAAAVLSAPAQVLAAATTPSAVVAAPASYEGKPVSVSGTVAQYQTVKTPMGPISAYQICDTKCVVVIDETNGAHKDGDTVTASGTFQSTFKGRQRSYKNVVLIK